MAKMGRPPVENPKKCFSVRFEPEVKTQIEAWCAVHDMRTAVMIRLAVDEFLKKHK